MKHFKRTLAILLALVMVLSCVGSAFAAEKTQAKELTQKTELTQISKNNTEGKEEALKGFKSVDFRKNNAYQYADDEIVRAIVILEGKTVADAGMVGSIEATAQQTKLDNQHKNVFKAMAGIDYELKFEYTRLLNGFSCDVAYGDLEAIAAIHGVESVHIANSYASPVVKTPVSTDQVVANEIVGNTQMHSYAWDGYGIVVAVLDTGLTLDHEAFQYIEGRIDEVVTEESVAAADLYGAGKYISAKVPFAYDYAEGDDDVTDYNGHGTHVSGSAVGLAATLAEDGESLNVTFAGAAPFAQLLSMKIFKDGPGGTTSDVYFGALEDAYTLGADVINMSIGAQNGFTYDDSLETEVFGNIYRRLSDAGIILSVAAGNEYSMAENASSYHGYAQYIGPEYTDYGTVASPSTYEGNVSVASMENAQYPDYVVEIDGATASFVDSCADGEHGWLQNFGGKQTAYQVILDAEGNFSLGVEEDFAAYGEELAGKIAVVSRGEIDFETKVENAANAGAIGCIVVNNQEGIISMAIESFEIPAISVQQSAIELLSVTGSITVPEEMVYVQNPNAYLMSEFSNWGTSPMLTLDPTITGIGGNIYSAVPGGSNTYEVYSGTSMAAPNMTGIYASLLSAIYVEFPEMEKPEAAELAKDLIYSSAIMLKDKDEYYYSPRKTGAGLGSAWEAIWNLKESAYITNPIQELGDDPEKTGVYEMAIELKNASEFKLLYTQFEAYVLFDYLITDGQGTYVNSLTSDYAYLRNDEETDEYGRGANITYEVNGTEVTKVELAPGESVTIDVTIELTEEMKAYFDEMYPNGTFVEGYVVFNEIFNDEIWTSNHATFLAYYGDWTQANVLEEADFEDVIAADNFLGTTIGNEEGDTYAEMGYNWQNSGLIDFYTNPNMAFLADAALTKAYVYAGNNMLDYVDYYPEHIAFSTPLSDGTYNYAELLYMEPYLLRNARHLVMTVSNKETGEIYYVDDTEYLPKAIYDYDYASWMATASYAWDGTDAEGNYVPSGTVATITYDAVLPYGETLHKGIWGFDVTVDYTAPVLEEIVFDEEAMTLTVTASDENYLQAIYLADMSYDILAYEAFSSEVKGESFTAIFDVSELIADGNKVVYVTALDYATNEMEQRTCLFDAGKAAAINLVTPYGTQTINTVTGEDFTFPVAAEPENYIFMFWGPEVVEQVSEDEVWYVPSPWWFDGDTMIVEETEYTFYALYAVVDRVPLETANYFMDYGDYAGDWAICGWNLDAEYHFVTEDPIAMGGEGNNVRIVDLEDGVIGDHYIEFFTNKEDIRFTFEEVGEDLYTIQNAATGKYLAATAEYEIAFVEEATELAQWNVVSAGNGYGTLVTNTGVENAVLVYDDEAQKFAIYDNAEPYYGEYYPNEWFATVLYRCMFEEEVVLYYTTECDDVVKPCYFDDFTDCTSEWYHEAVDYVVANGLMKGMSETKFGPKVELSRAMIVTVMWREAGSPEASEPSTFVDVPEGKWYSEAIAWAQDNGIVTGVTDTIFAPEKSATREQIATILWRYSGSPEATADLSGFGDAEAISSYAETAINWAVAEGILKGDANANLNPRKAANRAEFACMIMRYLEGSYTCND